MMGGWENLLSLLILFGAALVLGTLAEELKQSSIIGYLAAGMLVGPNALGWVGSADEMSAGVTSWAWLCCCFRSESSSHSGDWFPWVRLRLSAGQPRWF